MLKTRLLTASILIIGLITALLYASNLIWGLIALVITMIAAYEWAHLIKLTHQQTTLHLIVSLTIGFLIVFFANHTYVRLFELITISILGLASFIWIIGVPYFLFMQTNVLNNKFVNSLIGIITLSASLIAFIGLHKMLPMLVLGVIATISIADSAAYFSGKQFGKHKLAPSISPGKTWEGVIGALIAVALFGFALTYYFNYDIKLIAGLMILVVWSIFGDLFESKLKRQAGLKDSGQILPGHGGVLDRIDGIMPTITLTYIYFYLPTIFLNGFN